MTAAAVIAFSISQVSTDSGAAGASTPSVAHRAQASRGRVAAPERCPSAHKAVRFYQRRYREHLAKMGAAVGSGGERRAAPAGNPLACPRYLARLWQHKAYAMRLRVERWLEYNYAWRSWLPPVWKAIIACETHSTHTWNSGTYQGAYGFHYGSWDAFRLPGYPREAYDATPRQQFEVALAIWRRYGFTGWGCA